MGIDGTEFYKEGVCAGLKVLGRLGCSTGHGKHQDPRRGIPKYQLLISKIADNARTQQEARIETRLNSTDKDRSYTKLTQTTRIPEHGLIL